MKLLRWNALDAAARSLALQRPTQAGSGRVDASVAAIIDQVRAGGDTSIRELTRRLDGVQLEMLRVDEAEFADALAGLAPELLEAMIQARERLIAWHRAGSPGEFEIETAPGVRCGRILRGIGRVGLYVPAGSAPLPSTALMLGVPAALAGCAEVVVCTPPRADGKADPAVLAACSLCGIATVFKIGGAQAIAALAFGTETVPACDKIFGPGNAYVTAAKQQVSTMPGGAAIDMPAGPSEVLVVADDGASPAFVAADLLSQAEHGPDSQVILVSDSERLLTAVAREVEAQVLSLPRARIARASLEHARLILVDSMDSAIAISNDYAPEHLILALRDAQSWLPSIRAAGSVFLGDHAPESLGDYCSGTNHVLPTSGAARAFSGIGVSSFQVAISTQSVSRAGLAGIGPCAVTMARAEGLEAHARSILVRLGEPA